jgi:Tfp pilus assembly protein FimT
MTYVRVRSDTGFTAIEALIVCATVAVIGALSAPLMGNMLGYYRLSGDARNVMNSVATAKMRAASSFSQTRLFVSLAARTFRIEQFQRTPAPGRWIAEGGTTALSGAGNFGFGSTAVPPPNTQTTIGQSPQCLDDAGAAIAGTACIVFNSRGLPIDTTGAPTAVNAYYLTDGVDTYGVTTSATGMIRLWRTPARTTPTWALQ